MRLITAALLLLCGCSAAESLRNNSAGSTDGATTLGSSIVLSADIEVRLRNLSTEWLGTPHREGGQTREGIDAPALVQLLAQDVMGVELPRNTTRQLGIGIEIVQGDLLPGDIVFFRPTSMPRHVGVYLGQDEFVHSWPETGVAIARMDDSYWNGAFWAGRRLLADSTQTRPTATPETERAPRRRTRRVGW